MKTKVGMFLLRWFAGGILREVAEGKRGAALQHAYLKLIGWKSTSGWLLALLLAAVYATDPELAQELAPTLGSGPSLLVGWGFLDKQWRESEPPEWVGEGLRTLLSLGPVFSAIGAVTIHHLSPEWAERVNVAAGAVAFSTAWLAARMAPPPKLPLIPKPGR